MFKEAVVVCREQLDQNGLAQALTELGRIERNRQNVSQAIQLYNEAAEIYRSLPSPLRFAHTIRHVGDMLREQGSSQALGRARTCYEKALSTYRAHTETPKLDLANTLRGFALLREQAGEKEAAAELWKEASQSYRAAGVQQGVKEADAHITSCAD